MPERVRTRVGNRELTLSHLDKPLWPDFSKAQVLDYYLRVADALVPHLARRAASFVRCPDGPSGPRFFTHSADSPTFRLPSWVRTATKGDRSHVTIDDVETLIACVNAYCLEIHVPQWTAESGPGTHDRIVFDLDPGDGAGLGTCCEVAVMVRDQLAAAHLQASPVTSGGAGLHVYVGLNPAQSADAATAIAKTVAQNLARARPELITAARGAKARENGRVLIDWLQNSSRATTAAPYTLRVREDAPGVAVPLTWAEVEAADPAAIAFTPADVIGRVAEQGDLTAVLLDPAPF